MKIMPQMIVASEWKFDAIQSFQNVTLTAEGSLESEMHPKCETFLSPAWLQSTNQPTCKVFLEIWYEGK